MASRAFEEYSSSRTLQSLATAPHGGTSYFQGARNLRFADLSITNVHGDYYNTFAGSLNGLSALHQQISENAMFDSAARYSSGRCHPGTRTQVLEMIMDWIHDPSPPESIIWLSGTAGIGKSAIMQTIAELLSKETKELHAASFFFAHDVEGRREGFALIPTLAYQMAVNLPGMRELVDQAMEWDLTLPTKSMAIQMRSLIIEPLKRSSKEFIQHSPTVLIDGLDECQGPITQCQLLNIISEALRVDNIPLRFIIASRPEYWIKNTFEGDSLCNITKKISLNELQFADMESVNSDIAMFLRESFDEIYAKHSHLMKNIKRPWPSPDIIDRLVYESSGQFLYASTIIKFVGHSSDFCDPVKQLELLLIDSSSRLSAFSELDLLYTRITSFHPRPDSLKAVLGGILLRLPPLHIQHLLGVDESELIITLDFLSSVVDRSEPKASYEEVDQDLVSKFSPPGSRTVLKFCHKSFIEYLSDSRRSGQFFIDLGPICDTISTVFLNEIRDCERTQKFSPEGHSSLSRPNNRRSGLLSNGLRPIRDAVSAVFLKSIRDNAEKCEETHDLIYYHGITRILSDRQFGKDRLIALLHEVQAQVGRYITARATISRPATLLRTLHCVQKLISQNSISEFHDFASITLDRDVFPKIVKSMYQSGTLAITDNLIYFSSPIPDVAELQAISTWLGSGLGSAVSPKTFLLENAGIMSMSYNVIPGVGMASRECYVIEPYIRNVLENGTGELQIQYRLHYVRIALQCLEYMLKAYRQPLSSETVIKSRIPSTIITAFLDTPQLSDIRDEQDLSNTTFMSFLSTIMQDPFWKPGTIFDLHQFRSLDGWKFRQKTNRHVMDALKKIQPDGRNLASKLMDISGRIYSGRFTVNNMTFVNSYMPAVNNMSFQVPDGYQF